MSGKLVVLALVCGIIFVWSCYWVINDHTIKLSTIEEKIADKLKGFERKVDYTNEFTKDNSNDFKHKFEYNDARIDTIDAKINAMSSSLNSSKKEILDRYDIILNKIENLDRVYRGDTTRKPSSSLAKTKKTKKNEKTK